jgi:predicted ribosome quality control (RQC) complex YloA/Tae2 family protein
MRSTFEDQPAYLSQPVAVPDQTPMIVGGGTLLLSVIIFFSKWGFIELSNNLKEDITGIKTSITDLSKIQQQFTNEYVRRVEFDRAVLKIENQTEHIMSRLENKIEKLTDKLEQVLIKERGN